MAQNQGRGEEAVAKGVGFDNLYVDNRRIIWVSTGGFISSPVALWRSVSAVNRTSRCGNRRQLT